MIVVTDLPSSSLGKVVRFALTAANEVGQSQAVYNAVRIVGAPDTPTDTPVIVQRISSTSLRISVIGVAA